jgi:hypothetical protein
MVRIHEEIPTFGSLSAHGALAVGGGSGDAVAPQGASALAEPASGLPPRLSRRSASLSEAELQAAVERVWAHITALHRANATAPASGAQAYAHRRLPAAHVARSLQDELRKMPERNRLDFSIALGVTLARRLGAADAKRMFAREIYPLLKKALTFSRTEHRDMRSFRLQLERERGAYLHADLTAEDQAELLGRYVDANMASTLVGWVLIKSLRTLPSDTGEAVRAEAASRARAIAVSLLGEPWAAFDRQEFCGWIDTAAGGQAFS